MDFFFTARNGERSGLLKLLMSNTLNYEGKAELLDFGQSILELLEVSDSSAKGYDSEGAVHSQGVRLNIMKLTLILNDWPCIFLERMILILSR